ncbi:MAG: putative sugar O-methyltransferase [Lachnospiraceae bacterium]|nr:putative sugar O-methyltransferase [Lachnospiraceae bacterium]
MDKVIIFGMGKMFKWHYQEIKEKVEIVAVTDNNLKLQDTLASESYVKPEKIKERQYDYVLICCSAIDDITNQLYGYGIKKSKIKTLKDFLSEQYHLSRYKVVEDRRTSMCDLLDYPAFCLAAAQDQSIFKQFRRCGIYTSVVEGMTCEEGQAQLDEIKKRSSIVQFSMDDWDRFRKNDCYGDPIMYDYLIQPDRKILLSPVTVRYVKILQDIVCLFAYKDISVIAEIGVGFGGQARLIAEYLSIQKYYLIDIPEAIKLVEVFLGQFGKTDRFILCDGTKPLDKRNYDLVISNYAFSELTKEVQDIYLNSVILNSHAGYMIWNDLGEESLGAYSVEELLEIIPDSKVMEEVPLTAPNNKLIVWGTKC